MPWSGLVVQIAPCMPKGKRCPPPFPVESLLPSHVMRQWFTLSDLATEEALYGLPLFCDFSGQGGWDHRLPDERAILRLRHVKVRHCGLAKRAAVRLGQSVNGAQAYEREPGVSVPRAWEMGTERTQIPARKPARRHSTMQRTQPWPALICTELP